MHPTQKEARASAALLQSAKPDKDLRRDAWMTWRGVCLREAKYWAQAMDMSAFLEACGSPD